jgi:hypothetical protein
MRTVKRRSIWIPGRFLVWLSLNPKQGQADRESKWDTVTQTGADNVTVEENSPGYKLVYTWGCEFRKLLRENPYLENELRLHPVVKSSSTNIRGALYGGRTEATKICYKAGPGEEIHYFYVISLYPDICKCFRFPIGHPRVYVESNCPSNCMELECIIKCRVMPPWTSTVHNVQQKSSAWNLLSPKPEVI